MNVFVLSTGRCGSSTVARAFGHATNFTASHESRTHLVEGRLDYPDQHIESDCRLAWFLGSLDRRFGDRAEWIHLTRDPNEVVESYWRRWEAEVAGRRIPKLLRKPRRSVGWFRNWLDDPTSTHRGSIVRSFGYDVVLSWNPLTSGQRRDVCALYVATVNENVAQFLAGKPRATRIRVEHFESDFAESWAAIGAQGSLDAAAGELRIRHNRFVS